MRFIGDVHGKFAQYLERIGDTNASIQIGDMGIGFCTENPDGSINRPEPPFEAMKQKGNHRFIRGNHDNPAECRKHDLWIADGYAEGDTFFCGGALSAGRVQRTEGLNWWPEEELSEPELARISEKYLDLKPILMVTHDCPHSVAEAVLRHHRIDKAALQSRTRRAFQAMWEAHKPETWIFGHWHLSYDQEISGTRFICLNELETVDI